MNVAIIGGGAAGYFTAINIKELVPDVSVTIFEASDRSLAKVAVSGGGRCNLTNSFAEVSHLGKAYPRGVNLIKRAFKTFDHNSTKEWFESHGVELVTQEDQCLFPKSQSSQEIIDTFLRLANDHNIEVKHSCRVASIDRCEGGYEIAFTDDNLESERFNAVVVTTGGSSNADALSMISSLELKIEQPIPSLFTFNIPNNPITMLMGTVVDPAQITLRGSKLLASGALLITHWGMSGPAVLKLSSYGARILNQADYNATIAVNWANETPPERVLAVIQRLISENSGKLVTSAKPFNLPSRIWMMLLVKAGIAHERRFAEIGSKGVNRLVNVITNDEYVVDGQSRFREEFVTCGGVALSNINLATLECKEHPNLYFAGEVLDVDAITGGFNLQAAWSMGYVVATSIATQHTKPTL
ncbi:MAG: aminoacetone oxidase family FAD-binding enzyme [Rikenellaceae bacterium]